MAERSGIGRSFCVFISNHIDHKQLSTLSPDTDPFGQQNWLETGLRVEIVDSAFFQPDAVLEILAPTAIFHNSDA